MLEKVNKPLALIVVFNVFFGFLFFGLSRRAALQNESAEEARLGIIAADVDRSELASEEVVEEEPLPMPVPSVPRKVEITLEPFELPKEEPEPVAPKPRSVAKKKQIPLTLPSEIKYVKKATSKKVVHKEAPKKVVKRKAKPKRKVYAGKDTNGNSRKPMTYQKLIRLQDGRNIIPEGVNASFGRWKYRR